MKRYEYKVAGEPVVINRVETEDDLDSFREFVKRNLRALAFDSETTGLKMYEPDFGLRLVQVGNRDEAYVLPVERGGWFAEDARRALRGVQQLVFQNGVYDLQVFDRHLGVPMEELWPKVLDTKIVAHLVDSRAVAEGGTGHGLEDLTRYYIDQEVADDVKGSMTRIAKEHKTTKSRIWSVIDAEHAGYVVYAGMDVILTARVAEKVCPLVPASAEPLVQFEHRVAEVCSYLERTGFLLDVDYARGLSARLQGEEAAAAELAASMGVENVNSTEQVADGLEAMGVRIKGRTPSGKRKVDKVLLDQLTAEGNELALAVHDAKKARKWRTTWVDRFLAEMDTDQRCHANIQSLRARTGRMSITGIPAQTLPSSDWMIRRCFVADPGETIVACDYQTQELRVLAALSGDRRMQRAFANGDDLHQITADMAGVSRKVGKTTNFAKVYGSGPANIASQCGIDFPTAKRVVEGFERAYPGVKTLGDRLQQQAQETGFVTTPSGRRLYVDQSRGYSALNYLVQSTSRDITARALLRLHDAGFTPYLRLPVHDEVVCSVPSEHAEWGAKRISSIMAEQFKQVHVGSDHEVGCGSWGSLYFRDDEGNLIGRDPQLTDMTGATE